MARSRRGRGEDHRVGILDCLDALRLEVDRLEALSRLLESSRDTEWASGVSLWISDSAGRLRDVCRKLRLWSFGGKTTPEDPEPD